MKIYLVLLSLLTFLCLPTHVAAQSVNTHERIMRYHSDIIIRPDTSLEVTETIKVYVTGDTIKHGIFRDFPTEYTGKLGIKRVRGFRVLSVMRNGHPVPYKLKKIQHGVRLQIGKIHYILSHGEHTYSIKYTTTRQLGYFSDHDELYWNVTGNGWRFDIDEASATVTLPPGAKPINSHAWTGTIRSQEKNVSIKTVENKIHFKTTQPLTAHEGLTIKVLFSTGALDYAKDKNTLGRFLKDNPDLIIIGFTFLLITGYLFTAWIRWGRDPKAGTIFPRYDAPEGLSAAAIRQIYTMQFDNLTHTASILGLAAKGALTIAEKYGVITLQKKKPHHDLTEDELLVWQKLFRKKNSVKVLTDNHRTFSGIIASLRKFLNQLLIPRYYSINGVHTTFAIILYVLALIICLLGFGLEKAILGIFFLVFSYATIKLISNAIRFSKQQRSLLLRVLPWTVAVIFTVVTLLIIKTMVLDSLHTWFMLATVIVIHLFNYLNKAYTKEGRAVLDHILGLRKYLSIAEKDRLNLENPPERTPEHFEEFLPYAFALGVDQAWCEQFHDVLKNSIDPETGKPIHGYPSYFHSTSYFDSGSLTAATAALGTTLAANIAAAAVDPSAGSRSGSGGFSGGGGGFSGGGGGGGGGGGW